MLAEPKAVASSVDPRNVAKRNVILIIDDNPQSIRNLSSLIRDQGDIVFATTGEKGMELARKVIPDLILLDVEMPDISGYEVCRRLKNDILTEHATIVIVTSHKTVECEVTALEAGAADFITKPLNAPVVRARVKTQLMLKQQANELVRQAEHDGLTGAFNRRYFDKMFDQEWRRHQRQRMPLSVALIDIDYFKAFNDCYGHLKGDECLKRVAAGLERSLRRPGEFVARYGGEEFAIVLPYTDLFESQKFGMWVCDQIRSLAVEHSDSDVYGVVTVSVGVACICPDDQYDKEQLLNEADKALYQAKSNGRNGVVVRKF